MSKSKTRYDIVQVDTNTYRVEVLKTKVRMKYTQAMAVHAVFDKENNLIGRRYAEPTGKYKTGDYETNRG